MQKTVLPFKDKPLFFSFPELFLRNPSVSFILQRKTLAINNETSINRIKRCFALFSALGSPPSDQSLTQMDDKLPAALERIIQRRQSETPTAVWHPQSTLGRTVKPPPSERPLCHGLTIAIHSPSSSRSWAPDYRDSDTEWIAIVRPGPRGGSEITVHPSVLWGCQTAGAWNAVAASDSRCCIILSGGADSLSSICANDWSLGVLPGAENRAKQHLILLIDVSLLIINIFRWRMKDTEGFLRKSSENAKNRACL